MRPSAALKAVALVACAAGAAAWNPTPPLEGLNGALAEVGEAAQYVQGLAEEVRGAEALGIPESVDVEELVASLKPAKFAKKLNQYTKFAKGLSNAQADFVGAYQLAFFEASIAAACAVRKDKACRRSPSVSGGSFELVSPAGFNDASIKLSKKKAVNFSGLCKGQKKDPKCAATLALLDELAAVNVKDIQSLADFILDDNFNLKKDIGKLGKFVQKKKGREKALNALLNYQYQALD